MSASSSATSRSAPARTAASPLIISSATRERASGERSSCEAKASWRRCASTSPWMRSAARLKLRARSATSSLPSTGARAGASPQAERLDAGAKPLEPSREPPHERPGAQAHGDREQRQRPDQAQRVLELRVTRGDEPAPVGQADGEEQVAADARPVPAHAAALGQRQRRPHPGDERPLPACRPRRPRRSAGPRRSSVACSSATGRSGPGRTSAAVSATAFAKRACSRSPATCHQAAPASEREEYQHRDDRQVDLRREPPHHSSSCRRAKT